MRILLLVYDLHPEMPRFVEHVVRNTTYEIVGVGRVPASGRRKKWRWFKQQVLFWGVRGSLIMLLRIVQQKVRSRTRSSSAARDVDLVSVCHKLRVPLEWVPDVNAKSFVDSVRKRDIDVLVSCQPEIFRLPLLQAPKRYCINLHAGILPGYRGIRPVFRMMSDQLPELGVTVHTMTEKIDAGRILRIERWRNRPGASLMQNNRQAYIAGAKAVVAALDGLAVDNPESWPIVSAESPYFKSPNQAEVKAAKQKGLRLVNMLEELRVRPPLRLTQDNLPQITEQRGDLVSAEDVERLAERYHWAAEFCTGKDVLDVACGTGQGGSLIWNAQPRGVVAADLSTSNLEQAQQMGERPTHLVQLDAHDLPFADRSFDVVLMFEALYFLQSPARFVREARRVLRPGGKLLLSVNNRDFVAYSLSPYAQNAFGAPELTELLQAEMFKSVVYGGWKLDELSRRQRMLLPIKRVVTALGLIPGGKIGRQLLKPLMFGVPVRMPASFTGHLGGRPTLRALEPMERTNRYKILYAEAEPVSA